ncbi:MAG: carboxypeptidase regulatory-like domain-containing protein [Fimbriiglobus sp.]
MVVRVVHILGLFLISTLAVGCETPYSTVKGQVTLDGEPLNRALVGFFPEQGRGSYGYTDAEGRYNLMYTPDKAGVPAGKCIVRITTAEDETKERLPKKYHAETALAEEVKTGENVFDFQLSSK